MYPLQLQLALRRMATENMDYDKKFQEDLERAQALSLESLALEQFRNKKRLEQRGVSDKSGSSIHSGTSGMELTPYGIDIECCPLHQCVN